MADDFDLGTGDATGKGAETGGGGWGDFGGGGFGAGALGLGALGVGALLSQGPGHLPPQYQQLQAAIPGMRAEAGKLGQEGHQLIGQGTEALAMAQRGELTVPQQAELKRYNDSMTNAARQQYAAMGRNPDQDTSFIQTTGDIDARVNAMSQQQIQTTIQLGLGEISGGSSLIGQELGFTNAANQALIAAGEAQIKLDTQYSDSLTKAFTAIGQMFGTLGKAAAP